MQSLRSNEQRARLAVTMIWIVMAFDVLNIFMSYYEQSVYQSVIDDPFQDRTSLQVFGVAMMLFGIGQMVAMITCIVTFIQWFRRAYFNLHMMVPYLEHAEGWAAGAWFVPILNLFRPYQIMVEIYRVTRSILQRKDPEFNGLATEIVGWWWAFWVINGIISNMAFRAQFNIGSLASAMDAVKLSFAESVIGIPLAILAVRVIKGYAKYEPMLYDMGPDKDPYELELSEEERSETVPDPPTHEVVPDPPVSAKEKVDGYLTELRARNDQFINNIVTQNFLSPDYVNAARIVYEERQLSSPEKQQLLRNYDMYVNEAKMKLRMGLSIDEVCEYLSDQGIPPEHTRALLGK